MNFTDDFTGIGIDVSEKQFHSFDTAVFPDELFGGKGLIAQLCSNGTISDGDTIKVIFERNIVTIYKNGELLIGPVANG